MYFLRLLIGVTAWILALVVIVLGTYIGLSNDFGVLAKVSTGIFCALTAYTFWSMGFSVFKVLKFEKEFIEKHGIKEFEEMKRNSPFYSRKAYNEYMRSREG